MSVYRDEPCSFCELAAGEHCPRCQVAVCTTHAPANGAPHCTVCAKELKDDLDVVRFAVAVREEPPPSWSSWGRPSLAAGVLGLVEQVQGWWEERQVRRRFARRSLAEIAAWRHGAGIRARRA